MGSGRPQASPDVPERPKTSRDVPRRPKTWLKRPARMAIVRVWKSTSGSARGVSCARRGPSDMCPALRRSSPENLTCRAPAKSPRGCGPAPAKSLRGAGPHGFPRETRPQSGSRPRSHTRFFSAASKMSAGTPGRRRSPIQPRARSGASGLAFVLTGEAGDGVVAFAIARFKRDEHKSGRTDRLLLSDYATIETQQRTCPARFERLAAAAGPAAM